MSSEGDFSDSRAKDRKMSQLQSSGIYSETSTKISFEERQEIRSLSTAAGRELAEMEGGSLESLETPSSYEGERSSKEDKDAFAPYQPPASWG